MSYALGPRWFPLIPHPEQMRLITSPARFKIVPAGRRSGKSERAKRWTVIKALEESAQGKWLDYRYFLAAPTRDQARAIFWSDLKALVPKTLLAGAPRESDLTVRLVTGAEICVVGLDRPERIEGRSWNGGVIDEIANVKGGAWGEHVRPALSDRRGWCWLIGVPEGRGAYHEMYEYAISGQDPEWAGFHWVSADILPADEIESARRTLSPDVFAQEYEASFQSFMGRAYWPFDARTHCRPLAYNPRWPLVLAFDFNTSPGVAVICQEQPLPNGQSGTGVIGEVWIPRHSTTPAVCRKIAADWGDHQGPVVCYGDATGGAEGSARVQGSDWTLVRAELQPVFGHRLSFKVPNANPRERVRVNAVNSRLMSAAGDVRLMVDPARAPHMVKDLEGVRLLEGGSGEIDKKSDPERSHQCFAAGTVVDLDTGPCRIEDAPATGRVRTWDGTYVEFVGLGKTIENADIVAVSISDGSVIYCTPWHQWLTSMGWQCAENLEGLELKSWQSRLSRLPSRCSTESVFTFRRRASILPGRGGECTGSCGNSITAPFRRAISSITRTTTGQTTRSGTWSFSLRRNTGHVTSRMNRNGGGSTGCVELSTLGRRPLIGIGLRKAWNGIAAMVMRCADKHGLAPCPAPAPIAAGNIRQPDIPSSAARAARPRPAFTAEWMTRTEPAGNATARFEPTGIPKGSTVTGTAPQRLTVDRVQPAGKADVYCISVPSTGCFTLINGAVVSNSDALGYYVVKEFPVEQRKATIATYSIHG